MIPGNCTVSSLSCLFGNCTVAFPVYLVIGIGSCLWCVMTYLSQA